MKSSTGISITVTDSITCEEMILLADNSFAVEKSGMDNKSLIVNCIRFPLDVSNRKL
jgi:hypothetical protein